MIIELLQQRQPRWQGCYRSPYFVRDRLVLPVSAIHVESTFQRLTSIEIEEERRIRNPKYI